MVTVVDTERAEHARALLREDAGPLVPVTPADSAGDSNSSDHRPPATAHNSREIPILNRPEFRAYSLHGTIQRAIGRLELGAGSGNEAISWCLPLLLGEWPRHPGPVRPARRGSVQ